MKSCRRQLRLGMLDRPGNPPICLIEIFRISYLLWLAWWRIGTAVRVLILATSPCKPWPLYFYSKSWDSQHSKPNLENPRRKKTPSTILWAFEVLRRNTSISSQVSTRNLNLIYGFTWRRRIRKMDAIGDFKVLGRDIAIVVNSKLVLLPRCCICRPMPP